MQKLAKIVLYAILTCLLLLAGVGRRPHNSGRNNHIGRERQRMAVRLRRLRTHHSVHRGLHPSPVASLPPDEDDDDEERFRLSREDAHELRLVCSEGTTIAQRSSRSSAWRPSALDQPLYQTLCTLLL